MDNTSIEISRELFEQLKALADELDYSIQKTLELLLREYEADAKFDAELLEGMGDISKMKTYSLEEVEKYLKDQDQQK